MYHSSSDNYLIIITRDVVLRRYQITQNMKMGFARKVKLSVRGSGEDLQCVMAGPGLIAAANSESMVRFWDMRNDENYILAIEEDQGERDVIVSVSYNPTQRLLAGGSSRGLVYLWRFVGTPGEKHDDAAWSPLPPLKMNAMCKQVRWASGQKSLIAAELKGSVTIWNQHRLLCQSRNACSFVQMSKEHFIVQNAAGQVLQLQTTEGLRVSLVDADAKTMVISDGRRVHVYRIGRALLERAHVFGDRKEAGDAADDAASPIRALALRQDTVFVASGKKIKCLSLAGVAKAEIPFSDEVGEPRLLHVCGKFLVCVTLKNYLRIVDVSLRSPKLVVPKRHLDSDIGEGLVTGVRINCNGTMIALVANSVDEDGIHSHDTTLYIYDVNLDRFHTYFFGSQGSAAGPSQYPISCFWDETEPSLLAVQTAAVSGSDGLEASIRNILNKEGGGDSKQGSAASTGGSIRALRGGSEASGKDGKIHTMFVTSDYGILAQDAFAVTSSFASLMGVAAPYLYLMNRSSKQDEKLAISVRKKVLRDFVGLETASESERKDLMRFSYYLTVGNMDEAYRAVKKIESPSIWNNMAHTCIKTKRLDVAKVCLGNMKFAWGARAVREVGVDLRAQDRIFELSERIAAAARMNSAQDTKQDSKTGGAQFPEDTPQARLRRAQERTAARANAQVAMVAIQLGKTQEAEKLYIESRRYDLLVQLYQCQGRWDDAVRICEQFDRVKLRSTYFLYAQTLETSGDYDKAIEMYEKAGAAAREVPRMLFDNDQIARLEKYVQKKAAKIRAATESKADGASNTGTDATGSAAPDAESRSLLRWWAQYMASEGDLDQAKSFYEQAGDWFSLVKVLTHQGDLKTAREVVMKSRDRAAAYELAQSLEESEEKTDVQKAIELYKIAGRYNHGVRLAMEHGLDAAMVDLALRDSADPSVQVQVAEYFESRGDAARAVMLYKKANSMRRAVAICFENNLFHELAAIAETLGERIAARGSDADPGAAEEAQYVAALISRCGEFFMQNRRFDEAVKIFLTAGNPSYALELCVKHEIKLTARMAEKLTPEKTKDPRQNAERKQILKTLATCLHKQGAYHLACKKFTQAGDKISAIRSLLKSGDTEKIIYYATMTKRKEIYVLAANYLQSVDWRANPTVLKKIVFFYSKAKAFQKLSLFYDTCAQVEVDEYRDYEKAAGALQESIKYLSRSKKAQNKEERLVRLRQRVDLITKFVSARRTANTNASGAASVCTALLQAPGIESAVDVGDILGFLAEHHYKRHDLEQAYAMLNEMRVRRVRAEKYVDAKIVTNVCAALGREDEAALIFGGYQGDAKGRDDGGIDEEIGEEFDGGDGGIEEDFEGGGGGAAMGGGGELDESLGEDDM